MRGVMWRLRVLVEHFKLRLRYRVGQKARSLLHGRVRCVVLGHDHSVARAFPGIFTGGEVKVEWVRSTDASAGQLVEDLNAGVSIVDFIDVIPFSPEQDSDPQKADYIWGSEWPYLDPWWSE